MTVHRYEYAKKTAITLAILAVCLFFAKYGLSSAKHFAVLLAALLFVALAAWRPHWFIYITIISAFLTVPQGVKNAIHPGIYTIYYYEFFLVASVVFCAIKLPTSRAVVASSSMMAALVVMGTVLGSANGGNQEIIISQSQTLLDCVGAIYVAGSVLTSPYATGAIDTIRRVLWFSASLVLISAVTGLALAGRSEMAHLGNQVEDATRLITPTQFLALAVACYSLAVVLPGKVRLVAVAQYLGPAVLILLFAFSRSTLLALGVSVAIALIGSRDEILTFVGRLVSVVVIAALVIFSCTIVLANTPVGDFAARQATAFQFRVLGGLTSSSLATDPSILARDRENAAILSRIPEAPFAGHGFGFAYRAGTGVSPGYVLSGRVTTSHFDAVQSRYYVHNFYFWLLGQTGVIGLILFFLAIVRPVVTAVFPRSPHHLAFGAAGASLLAVSAVAPTLEDVPASLLVGCVIGALIAARKSAESVDSPAMVLRESEHDQHSGMSGGMQVDLTLLR